jgi:energy-coupling factor transport system ATP-binding protein
VDEILTRFGLDEHRHSYPRDLSAGEKQRVALAAVLISNPKVVVLDEPTRGIDAESRETLVSVIRGMLGEGRAVVGVTQDERLVAEVASGEIKLAGGVIEK